jgi:hypothetical protein
MRRYTRSKQQSHERANGGYDFETVGWRWWC